MRTDGHLLRAVTRLSLDGSNVGIIGAFSVLLALTALGRRWMWHSYAVEKECNTSKNWSSCLHLKDGQEDCLR